MRTLLLVAASGILLCVHFAQGQVAEEQAPVPPILMLIPEGPPPPVMVGPVSTEIVGLDLPPGTATGPAPYVIPPYLEDPTAPSVIDTLPTAAQ